MAQPEYVPLSPADRVRPAERLPVPDQWLQDRPAELRDPGAPTGRRFGTPGPDQGYALTLAHRFEDRLELGEGEHGEDAIAGCVGVALRRAALFGRAPVIHDLELAFTLWGFLGGAPADLVEYRMPLFQGVAHDYDRQREIAERVAESTLRLTPAGVREHLSEWRSLLSS
ncbi:MAG: hypothetical protein M3N68_08370 [Actinomycetota bacterium]|nr:hypothetical protein [Actinomycetota bacterium]